MNERIAKLEATLPYLATGKDVESLRTDIQREATAATRWTFGIVLTIVGLATGVIIFAIGRMLPAAPTSPALSPQPIVIQMPATPMPLTPAPAAAPASK